MAGDWVGSGVGVGEADGTDGVAEVVDDEISLVGRAEGPDATSGVGL